MKICNYTADVYTSKSYTNNIKTVTLNLPMYKLDIKIPS